MSEERTMKVLLSCINFMCKDPLMIQDEGHQAYNNSRINCCYFIGDQSAGQGVHL